MSTETSTIKLTPRALLHLLFNGTRAIDVVQTAYGMEPGNEGAGLLQALQERPMTLAELSQRFNYHEQRLYKFLDCLESMGLVRREQTKDAIQTALYTALPGVYEAAEKVVGPGSLERDREKYDWKILHGRLGEVLRAEHAMPRKSFNWPLTDPSQVADFEASMAAGLGPVLEVFRTHGDKLWSPGQRLLDVGGGDGTLAANLVKLTYKLTVDVYNLPITRELVERTRKHHELAERDMGFIEGDFLNGPLPTGYNALSFVRVLHDWPAETARQLMKAAYAALPSGGRILICEEFRTPERLTAQFFWSYFLMGVDTCVSRLREVEYYLQALTDVGFEKPEVLPGPFELIVATKPLR